MTPWKTYLKTSVTRMAYITNADDLTLAIETKPDLRSRIGLTADNKLRVETSEGVTWIALPAFIALDNRGHPYPVDPAVHATSYREVAA